ncbi:anaerobic sulfite reductase subunit B [Streptomyces pseudovenezuelae]|uniref:FAD/NAD(P)-binding protein n=1 Tax=unclassified Streptomyces TaxID=2593676 RepID=UPI0024756EC9|nr:MULTISPECIES: FAD/NAD(P)-binding protein [unclassified Streptomyces]MDH6514788.1 anaerobic sulfite reductase subunit B [Streptomyces sp. SAI-090]MDH6546969.1 anaerobic sulfite reductase subunit B [Streptomyces sp. SAI-041]MDH6566081.1 anaerobic sulfite reductase subunit B [Streptomyces sp. SAI-117]MDH6589009.1 anaerobic sulfite reductase subunit B [Streptomyces sp. SAI-133]MDH6621130.1 anaerobic sulfite reductase subunit B [Streptomyces sp. SAI-135]
MTALPVPYLVVDRRRETPESVTLWVEPLAEALDDFVPGQFAMVHCFGRGEIPLSVSSVQSTGGLAHTVRAVGAVSAGLCEARTGDVLGLRGPYGTGWELEQARGRDVLVVAGGIGLAPLRPLVLSALADPEAYGRISVLIGARTPADLIAREEPELWHTACTGVTVDWPDAAWRGDVGVVTQLLDRAPFEPANTCAFVCGPEPMIRATARELARRGMPPHRIRVSLERNMRCATGHCGHCQLGPLLVCRDGPVVGWDQAEPLLSVREL